MSDSRAQYERLIQDLRQDLRPQRDWGEGKGVLMVVGHWVVGVAAGTWLFSLWFGRQEGLLVAFVLAALGGLAHLGFLGHPGRFWRMALKSRTSWISRGFIGLALFLAGSALYVAPVYLSVPWGTGSAAATLGYALALAGMVVLMGYMGFVYTGSKGIPFWNSPLHPALYIVYALRGGVAALLVTQWAMGGGTDQATRLLPLWAGLTSVVILFFVLEIHGALKSGNAAARRSVQDLLAGRLALAFYGGTLLLGLLVPAWLAFGSPAGATLSMALIGLASAIGDFFIKYTTVRAGVHLPVWTRLSPGR